MAFGAALPIHPVFFPCTAICCVSKRAFFVIILYTSCLFSVLLMLFFFCLCFCFAVIFCTLLACLASLSHISNPQKKALRSFSRLLWLLLLIAYENGILKTRSAVRRQNKNSYRSWCCLVVLWKHKTTFRQSLHFVSRGGRRSSLAFGSCSRQKALPYRDQSSSVDVFRWKSFIWWCETK